MPKRNPSNLIFLIIGTVGPVLALPTIGNEIYEGLVKWKGFLAVVYSSYTSVTRPLFEFLLGWLPWDVLWLGDYYLIGIFTLSALYRGEDHITYSEPKYHWKDFVARSMIILVFAPLWPFTLYTLVKNAFLDPKKTNISHFEWKMSRFALNWMAAVVILIFILISINSMYK